MEKQLAYAVINTASKTVMLDEKNKPEIITYYYETKSGVGVLDKLVRSTYSCKRASSRCTVAIFLNILDIAEYNALKLWITANPNWQQGKPHRKRLFLHELATQLLHDHASTRFRTPHGKRRRIQKCTRRFRNHHCSDWPVLVTGWCD